MKKTFALVLCLALIASFGISAYAAGADDGKLKFTVKEDKTYLGTPVSDFSTYYIAADGSDSSFHRWDIDLNEDKVMNICDLVKAVIDDTDIDGDEKPDSADLQLFRSVLMGNTDY